MRGTGRLLGVVLFFLGTFQVQGNAPFTAQILSNGLYKVEHDGANWMDGGAEIFQADGKTWSSNDGSLRQLVPPTGTDGVDEFGIWNMINFTWGVGSKRVDTTIKMYHRADGDGLQFMIFSQYFPDGLENTSVGDANKVISAFPSVAIENGLGMLIYGDLMSGWVGLEITTWKTPHPHITDGLKSGPIVLFDKAGATMVMSPFSHFMAANMYHDTKTNTLNYGIMGSVNSIPAGYSMDTIIYYSDHGINDAMAGWGNILKRYYGKDPNVRYQDPTVQHLGYWTDNGAYYYQHTEDQKNYEQTILDVLSYSNQLHVPYRYLQFDDWWYYTTGPGEGYGATIKWEARPAVFPDGMVYIYNKTRMGIHAHNRYWSNTTVYAKQNGGQFDFVMSKDKSLPTQQVFWEYLFSMGVQWGLMVYEQDFLSTQMEDIEQLQTDILLGEKWLKQMGAAAARYGLRLQYCMALCRHVLTALEIPTVTQARVSADYVGINQWKIGISSMFVDAVGIAPFKDNFWTTTNQSGNPYRGKTEPNPLMQTVVALLSTGPVGPSDGVGFTNPAYLNMTCRMDGLLLKPSKPATAIDKQIMQSAFGGDTGPEGQVWTTYSRIGLYQTGIIFAAQMKNNFSIKPSDTSFASQFTNITESYIFNLDIQKPIKFSESSPLPLGSCSAKFCLFYSFTPIRVHSGTIVLLGEGDKIVTTSPQRVKSVDISNVEVTVRLVGVPEESIQFGVYYENTSGGTIKPITCVFPDSGTVTLRAVQMTCM